MQKKEDKLKAYSRGELSWEKVAPDFSVKNWKAFEKLLHKYGMKPYEEPLTADVFEQIEKAKKCSPNTATSA